LEDEIEGLISGLKLNASVLTPGFVQYAGLKEYYHNAFCFVHPASKDQWGLVVNEAMAAGLPVLVSSGCGCAFDLVEDGENGFVFDPTDTDKLAHLLLKMDEECDAFEFGQKSRLKIRDFSPNSFGRSLSRAISFSFEMPANPSFLSRLALRLYLSFLLIKNKKHV
jgi:glycosyltransferase involved in cell wall biosynthesis